MDSKTFFDNFETIANSPGGIDYLRKLICDLAVSGRLVRQDPEESHSQMLLEIFGNDSRSSSTHDSWIAAPLSECVQIFNGNSTDATTKAHLSRNTTGRAFVATKDVGYGFQKIDYKNGLLVPLNDKGFKTAPEGSVLICLEGGSAGRKMGLLEEDVNFGNKLFACVCKEWLDAKFLLISFLSTTFQSSFASGMSGIIGGISKKKFGEILISIPPLKEQKRITAKVQELMEYCDHLEVAQQKRDYLRTAARNSAIDTVSAASDHEEIAAAWNRINKNWSIFSDALGGIASLRQLILDLLMSENPSAKDNQESNWAIKKFSDLGDCRLGKMLDKAKNIGELHPYLRNTNVQWFRIDKSDIAEMRVSKNEVTEFTLKADDLLICEGGQPGRCSIVSAAEEGLLFQKALHRFRPNESTDVKFVAYSLQRASMNGTLERLFTGVTIKHLTGQSLKGFEIALPSVIEQRMIVTKVEELMALCDELEDSLRERNELASKIAGSFAKEIAA
jgi:type I restriction enzyme S subunit